MDVYRRYFERFDQDLFNPREWARAAREAGMKYVVATTKHHECFCLWDTQFTDFNAVHSPAGMDLLRPIVDAFREEVLRIGLYYSLLDWHHEDFTIDCLRPMRNYPHALRMKEGRNMARYAGFMRNQVRELLTNYGPVDIVWFDYSYP